MANTLNLFRQGAVGFIGWLDGWCVRTRSMFIGLFGVGRLIGIEKCGNLWRTSHQPERQKEVTERMKHRATKSTPSSGAVISYANVERGHDVLCSPEQLQDADKTASEDEPLSNALPIRGVYHLDLMAAGGE